MAKLIRYDGQVQYVGNRPYADLRLHGETYPAVSTVHLAALIDTGADYLELPLAVAGALKITLSDHVTAPVLTAGGTRMVVVVPNFYVDIHGKVVKVTAHLHQMSTALLGLDAILSAMDLGLNLTSWLHTK